MSARWQRQNKLRQTVAGLDSAGLTRTAASTPPTARSSRPLAVCPARIEPAEHTRADRRGTAIRAAFVVRRGYDCLLTADYSQIEMRLMAHWSQDAGLIDAFRTGGGSAQHPSRRRSSASRSKRSTPSSAGASRPCLRAGVRFVGLRFVATVGIPTDEAATMMEILPALAACVTTCTGRQERARVDGFTRRRCGAGVSYPTSTAIIGSAVNGRTDGVERPVQGSAARPRQKSRYLRVFAGSGGRTLDADVAAECTDELVLEIGSGEQPDRHGTRGRRDDRRSRSRRAAGGVRRGSARTGTPPH